MHSELLRGWRLLHLSLIASFPAFLAVFFAPALVDLVQDLELSHGTGERTMAIYFLGYAIGTLVYGPLSDRIGRKPTILIGFCATFLFTLLALWAGNTGREALFFTLRALQGVAGSCGMVALFMISDIHDHKHTARAIFSLLILFAIALGVGSFLGGIITNSWGWGGILVAIACYAAVQFLCAFSLPETVRDHETTQSLTSQAIDPFMLLYGVVAGLSTSLIYLFVSLAPHLSEEIQISASAYGLFSIIPFCGLLIGLGFSHHYKQMPRISLLSGIFYSLLGCITMQVFFVNEMVNIYTLFLLGFVILIAPGVIYPKAVQVVLGETTHKSAAFAVFQFLNLLIPSIILFLTSLIPSSSMVLPLSSGFCTVIALFVWFTLKAHHSKA